MEDPVSEIPTVIYLLCQSRPSVQRATIEKYFIPDATFIHPLCRTGSFNGSRWLIWCIYRWYKILSPRIEMEIDSVAYDARNLILYASLHQLFRIWIIPGFSAPVRLTTVLHLKKHSQHSQAKYLISSQNDLYQLTEVVLFGSYFRILWGLLIFWQFVATGLCVLGAMVLGPGMTWVEENVIGGNWGKGLADVVGDEGAGEGGILQGEKGVQH